MSKPTSRKRTSAAGHTPKGTIPKNQCFVCGPDNSDGMHLKFTFDEQARTCQARVNLPARFTGAPAHAHGGIVATLLDEAMGKVNKMRSVVALTRKMEVEFLKPVPLGVVLTLTGRERQVRGRKHYNAAELTDAAGTVLARSTGLFIAIDAEKMFGRFVRLMERRASPGAPAATLLK